MKYTFILLTTFLVITIICVLNNTAPLTLLGY